MKSVIVLSKDYDLAVVAGRREKRDWRVAIQKGDGERKWVKEEWLKKREWWGGGMV